MEHIVQFAINIDDETIKRRLEDNAYNDICKKIEKDAIERVVPTRYGRPVWNDLIDGALSDFLQDNKDAIIDLAAEKLVNAYKRTKAYKDTMKNALDNSVKGDN